MKFFRLDLLTLLISLFILNSCKNQSALGLSASGSSGIIGATLVDTSTIITNTVLDDSVATFPGPSGGSLAKNPLGYFTDPTFGVSVANLATDLNLPSGAAYTPPTGTIVIDSARLVLRFADGFYGDSIESRYTVNVYQLKTKYKTDTVYYNTKSWGDFSSSPLLGSLTFNSRTHDSIKIKRIIKGAPDTLYKVPPQIRIPIDPQFINTNLFNASTATLASSAVFASNVKGLYIRLDQTKTTGPGGIFMVSPTDSLAVYYRTINGATIDTSVVYLPVSHLAAQTKHTYTATIQTELNNTASSRGTIYLQGLAGLRAKISFPSLLVNLRNNLLKKDSDIVLNRAELVVTPVGGSGTPYPPIPRITLYRLDLAKQRFEFEDANSSDPRSGGPSVFGGFYSPTKQNYHFVITAYLQDLLLKYAVDYGVYIAPADLIASSTNTVPINATVQVGARTVAGGGANKSSPYSMKLNIIYTKVAKK